MAQNPSEEKAGDEDAALEGRSRTELANDHVRTVRDAIGNHRECDQAKPVVRGIFISLLATAILLFFWKANQGFFRKIYKRIDSLRGRYIRSIKIQSYEIISAEHITALLINAAKVFRILINAMALYLYLNITLSLFSYTKNYAEKLFHYLLSILLMVSQSFVSYLPNLFFLIITVIITYYILKITRPVFQAIEKGLIKIPGFYPEWADPTYKIVRFLIIILALIITFPYLPKASSPAFKGLSIFLGVLLSLGSTAAVANVIAGIIITYMRPFKVGDRVKIADTVGDAEEKSLLVTRVRSIKNVEITIPNSMVLSSHIINFSSSAQQIGLILHTPVAIRYDIPWRKVHELLIAAARSTTHILPEPTPFVLQTSLDSFHITYELNAYTDKPNLMARIYSDLHQNIQDRFNKEGVEIMSPHYTAVRDGNHTAIPEEYLPEGYTAPGFRISPFMDRLLFRSRKPGGENC